VTPLRLVIIGFLLYILYRLVTGPKKKKMQGGKNSSASSGQVQDVLVEDPVCHTYIPKGQAIQLRHNKQIYYFCSNKCYETFLEKKGEQE